MKQIVLCLALMLGAAPAVADAELVGQIVWREFVDGFGGISGIEIDAKGDTFVAISDRGLFLTGNLAREDGQITKAELTGIRPILDAAGIWLTGNENDSEGLAVASDGRIFVSFEGDTRVQSYARTDAAPEPTADHPDFVGFEKNSGLEALAMDAEGRLYTLPERSGRANRPFKVYRFDGQAWEVAFQVPRRGAHLPVGADIGPDGRFYLLERDFTGVGFRSRVRRFALDGSGETEILNTPNAIHDNLEGLTVWQDGDGALRLLMIADDNYKFFQQTEIVEYRLTD